MKNMAVYEGTLDILLKVAADPCADGWKVVPTSNELDTYPISYADCEIKPEDPYPDLSELYHVNESGLTIRKATSTDLNGQPISTAGLYTAYCEEVGETAAKFLVVRKCNSTAGLF